MQLQYDWLFQARPEQLPPNVREPFQDYTWWLFLGGRGVGKTKSGSEWIRYLIFEEGYREVACIGPSAREVRKVMVEGGILAASAPWEQPTYNKSSTIQTITWPNGAICHLLTAENPDRIRGYNLEAAWLDELAAWPENQFDEALYNIRMATRKGIRPKFCVTTTPKPHKPFIKFFEDVREWEKEGGAVITTGATFANAANLNNTFLKEIKQQYFDDNGNPTVIGRQEIFGEVLVDLDRRMWTEEMLADCQHRGDMPVNMRKIVVSVDPSGSQRGDEVGIIVFGVDKDKKGWLIDDLSGKLSPKDWAEVAVKAYYRYQANYIVGEVNYGGDMVKQNVQNYDEKVVFRSVHATRGKQIRAIPVAAVYERGAVKHVVGNNRSKYRDLERQMCDMTFQGYIGDGSPDRLDALVWAVHETMLKQAMITGVTTLY
jgi:phage terminase large subunit-like protein